MEDPNTGCTEELDRILASDAPDLDKLARAFGCITAFTVGVAEREIDLYRAMHDRDAIVKTQIKMETMKHARSIFEHCYLRITGKRAWPVDGSTRDEA